MKYSKFSTPRAGGGKKFAFSETFSSPHATPLVAWHFLSLRGKLRAAASDPDPDPTSENNADPDPTLEKNADPTAALEILLIRNRL